VQLRNQWLRNASWQRVTKAFGACAEAVSDRRPEAVVTSGYWGNRARPFWAWLSVERTGRDDEPLVLSVSLDCGTNGYSLAADLMVEHGPILTESEPMALGGDPSGLDLDTALDEVERFIRKQPQRISATL
jgi:hypothetical protein